MRRVVSVAARAILPSVVTSRIHRAWQAGGIVVICAVALCIVPFTATASAQAAAKVVAKGPIPRTGYDTWSLFLVCNPEWVTSERKADLARLYERYNAFGNAIGDDNLAVWFSTQGTPRTDSPEVDLQRAARYCRTLRLKPSEGPFLVITTSYPDQFAMPKERAVFELGGLSPAEIGKLLGSLTDDLLLNRALPRPTSAVNAAPAPATPPEAGPTAKVTGAIAAPSPTLWTRLLEGAQRNIIGFGCRVKLHIDTGLLSAEVRECKS